MIISQLDPEELACLLDLPIKISSGQLFRASKLPQAIIRKLIKKKILRVTIYNFHTYVGTTDPHWNIKIIDKQILHDLEVYRAILS